MDKIKFKSDLVIRKIGEEYVIVDPGQDVADLSNLFILNESALLLVNTFKDLEFTHADVVSVLLDNYDVDSEQASLDAHKWLKVMTEFDFFIR